MNNEVIKSFLVGLGFEVDTSSLKKFNKAIADSTLKVAALYGSIKITSTAVAFGITQIAESFEDLGYEYRLIAPAINKALILRREMLKAYSVAGVNIVKVVQSAVLLNISITKTKYALEAIYRSVGSRFFTLLTKQSDIFREKLYRNMPRIQNALEGLIKYLFEAFEGTVVLGGHIFKILQGIYYFFNKLHRATGGWSTVILAAAAAWRYLNLAFLATPLGQILAGLSAILLLVDDLAGYREGRKSFFNWSYAIPVIDTITAHLEGMMGALRVANKSQKSVVAAILKLFSGDIEGSAKSMASALLGWVKILEQVWNWLVRIQRIFLSLGGKALKIEIDKIVNSEIETPDLSLREGIFGTRESPRTFNQEFKQETTIQVTGSADAHFIAKKLQQITYDSYGYAFSNLQRYTRRQIQ